MTLNRWVLLCAILALPCVGAASLIVYLGGSDAASPSDRDKDGLLDSWELEHFSHLDFGAQDDPDEDGICNRDELARGTLPSDRTSACVTLFVSEGCTPLYDGLTRTWDGAHGPKSTISAALDVSFSGDTVHVLPGSYPEDVNISGMDVTLSGEGLMKGTL